MSGAQVLPASRPIRGTASVPSDKAISHRGAILGALARGTTVVRRFSGADDCGSTLGALRALGAGVERDGETVRIDGWGARGPAVADAVVECGRSGTTMRLLCGALAGFAVSATLSGDPQLRARPMERVAEPLRLMGAEVATAEGGRPPIRLTGAALRGIDYALPMASAQVKSAVLLAGLAAAGATTVVEKEATRDHTERLLRAMGATIESGRDADGRPCISVEPSSLGAVEVIVPADPSSAAPLLVAAALVPGSDLRIRDVGLNPTRAGLLAALIRMGARVEVDDPGSGAPEPAGMVRIESRPLRGIAVGAAEVPAMIDELPLLGLLGTQAEGTTDVRGAEELRVKESDRIAVLVKGLRDLGADIEELPDGFVVRGPVPLRGGEVDAAGDHRMAMAFAVAGLIASGPVRVRGMESVGDSFPGFLDALEGLR